MVDIALILKMEKSKWVYIYALIQQCMIQGIKMNQWLKCSKVCLFLAI
jgi:hypothetical protein